MKREQDATSQTRQLRRKRLRRRRRARHSRRRQWVSVGVLVLALSVLIAYRTLTSQARLRRLATAYLQEFFTTDVSIDEVSFSLLDGIQLTKVTVADRAGTSGSSPLLSFDGMWLRHDPLALFAGRFDVDEIVASRPVCHARFDEQAGNFNIQQILRLPDTRAGRTRVLPLPEVRIQEARLLLYPNTNRGTAPVEDMSLALTGISDPSNAKRYDVAWVTQTDRHSKGHFVIDLQRGVIKDVAGGAPWLSLEAAMLAVEASEPRAKRWIDLLGVAGHFRIVDYAVNIGKHAGEPSAMAFELDGASLSVPIDPSEDDLPASERFVRLEAVSGRFAIDSNGVMADLTGKLREATCRLQGQLRGDVSDEVTFADIGFDLTIELENFNVPRPDPGAPPWEQRFVNRWWRVQRFYRDFDPRGRVDLRTSLTKAAGDGASVQLVRAELHPFGAETTIRFFPYPVTNVRGELVLAPDGVFITGLTGEHGATRLTAHGWATAMSMHSASTLYISGADVALNEALCSALRGRHRRTWETFSPEGVADIDLVMTRPASEGTPAPWDVAIYADLVSVDARFDAFPYPIRELNGEVQIVDRVFQIDQLRGRCGNGDLQAAGIVADHKGGQPEIDLHIQADSIPLDNTLIGALPERAARQFAALNARGSIGLDVHVFDADDHISYDARADVRDATAKPDAMPFTVEALAGDVRVTPERVAMNTVTGRVGDGALRAHGWITREEQSEYDIALDAQRVTLTDDLRSALPESIATRLEPWRIDGTLDVDAQFQSSPKSRRVRIRPAGATLQHASFPIAWKVQNGEIDIEDDRVTIRDAHAVGEGAELSLAGEIHDQSGSLEGSLTGVALTNTLREALPWRLRRQWNNVDPSGAIDLAGARMTWAPRTDADGADWTFGGNLVLHDVGMRSGIELTRVNGLIPISGGAAGTLSRLAMQGDLRIDRATVAGVPMRDATGRLLIDAGNGRIRLDDLSARMGTGVITGEVGADTKGRDAAYHLNATMQRLDLQQLAEAFGKKLPDTVAPELIGALDGRVYLTGDFGDVADRRGGGLVRIRDARLYRLPLILAILNVLDLQVTDDSAFQEASAKLTIVGQELRIDDLELFGEALAMSGEGTIHLPTKELDLRLIAVSPHDWARLPVMSEMLEGMARELVEVHVTGTLGDPRVAAKPLRNVEAGLEALLSLRKAKDPLPISPGKP
jgi:hypothetical protein